MAFDEKITNPGQGTSQTLDGTISLNEQSGNIIVQDQGDQVLVIDKTGVLQNDNTDNRVRLGKRPNGESGLFVSKPGFNVETATDAQLIFNSNQNTFKIAKVLTGTTPFLTVGVVGGSGNNGFITNQASTNIPHGMSAPPAFLAFMYDASLGIYVQMPTTTNTLLNRFNYTTFVESVSSDGTNIVLTTKGMGSGEWGNSFNGGGNPVKIYILQETAS